LQGFFPTFGREDLANRSLRPSRIDSVRAPESSTKIALRAPRVPSGTALPHRASNDLEPYAPPVSRASRAPLASRPSELAVTRRLSRSPLASQRGQSERPTYAPRRSRSSLAAAGDAAVSRERPTVPSLERSGQSGGKRPSLWERPEEGTLGRGLARVELSANDFWAPLRDTAWRVAVPVAPVLFTLGLLVAAHLDLSRQPKAAMASMDLVASRAMALEVAMAPDVVAPVELTGELLLVSEVPNTRVFRDGALLGTAPVRLRLPEGPVALEAELGVEGPRTPLTLQVAGSELQIVSLTHP
jgi:hypothetical protein